MKIDKGIYIKNIYYMLSYAFSNLKQTNYEKISSEEFDHIYDLLAEILYKGVSQQIKQGLYREYVLQNEELMTIRGKIDISSTIKNRINRSNKITCEYDELTENNIYNQILKATMLLLIRKSEVNTVRKIELKKLLMYFDSVDSIEISSIFWNQLHYQRNNQSYQLLVNICYFVIKNQLLQDQEGTKQVLAFTEEYMHRLYEKFILEYYRTHYPWLHANPSHIPWDTEDKDLSFMPNMISDIHLSDGNKTMIIDAKYYGKTMQEQFDKKSFHSHNLYQIMAYVLNDDIHNEHTTKGVLLYAKTNESIVPDKKIKIKGYEYEFTTLDLNTDFKGIQKQLNTLVDTYF